jgi:23S rRNA-/tRNA-specific pseudouridylate synthase
VEPRSIAGKGPPPVRPAAAAEVRHLTVDAESAGQRLDNYLMRLLKGVPKTHIYRVIRSGEVRVNKGRAGADTRVAAGDVVRVPPMRLAEPSAAPPAPAREFPILLEDEHLLAIAKPAGVAVHGGSGVSFGVIEQLRRARPQARFLELVHRLDKETSGILLLAKKRSALTALQDQFRTRDTGKVYAALVFGAWPASLKVIDLALHKTLDAAGERHVRVVPAEPRRRPAFDQPGEGGAPAGRRHAAGREHQDRPHTPDPRPPGAQRPPHRRRPQVRRLCPQQGLCARTRLWRACSCTPGSSASTTPPAASASPCAHPCPMTARHC